MKQESELHRRLRSLQALGSAVGAMKSLSAHHFRQARAAVPPAHAYREGIERLRRNSGATFPAGTGGAGLLVIGAELGLCGSYSVRIVDLAEHRRVALGAGPTLCVGRRSAARLSRGGIPLTRVHPAPTTIGGIPGVLLELGEELLRSNLGSLEIVSARFVGVGAVRPTSTALLPLEDLPPEPLAQARYASQDRFAEAAVRELLYITLYDLLLDAVASEHGARLVATQAAEKWLDERATRVRRQLADLRRETTTQEMLEIATAARSRRMPADEPLPPRS